MAFDIKTLITDRTAADVASGTDKGFYNATDLNRVGAALEDLAARFRGYGYAVQGYQRVKIQRSTQPASRLPEGYTEVQYIQSSGGQYIDTGFIPDATAKVIADFQFTTKASANSDVFGVVGQFSFRQYGGEGHFRTVSGSYADFSTSVDVLSRHTVEKTMVKTVIDGVNTASTTAATVSSSLYLFAYNRVTDVANYGILKLYVFQTYNSNVVSHDFVPCISPDNLAGLYDLVEKKFYGNAGTGSFEAGPAVTLPEDLNPYTWYERDVPTASQMEQYRVNISSLRAVIAIMASTPETPETMRALDYVKANNIERILQDLNTLITNMEQAWFFSGDLYAGEI